MWVVAVGFMVWAGVAAAAEPIRHITVGALDRAYTVERVHPEAAGGRVPIVIFLPGVGTKVGEKVSLQFDIPFRALAGGPPMLVIQPQGVDRRWDSLPSAIDSWQRLSGTDGTPVDDIGFLRALIDKAVAVENGDPARVYIAGVSAGGYLAAKVACEMGDRVAAVADVIATAREAVFQHCDGPAVPFALIVSTTDEIDPYAGTRGDGENRLASAPETAFFFARHNGCGSRTETPVPHVSAEASTASLVRFGGCREGAEVLFWRVDGSGHSVPSTAPNEADGWARSGRRNRDFDTNAVLWAFFSAHRRDGAAGRP